MPYSYNLEEFKKWLNKTENSALSPLISNWKNRDFNLNIETEMISNKELKKIIFQWKDEVDDQEIAEIRKLFEIRERERERERKGKEFTPNLRNWKDRESIIIWSTEY